MSPSSILITGCNRGIGLELVKQYLEKLDKPIEHLIATYRDPAKSQKLFDLAKVHSNLHLLHLDVSNQSSYEKFVADVEGVVGDKGLNLLINNAGILHREENTTADVMRETFEVNCIAPLFLTKALLPLIKTAASKNGSKPLGIERAAIIMVSSTMGSLTSNNSKQFSAYSASKAALNMLMKNLSIELRESHILVMSMHPGWVRTDMGGPDGMIDVETCGSEMIKTLEGLSEKNQGGFLAYDNTVLPW